MKYNNWIDLSQLPRKGKLIDWSSTNNNTVKFSYNGIEDICTVNGLDENDKLKLIIVYKNKEYKINRDNFKNIHLGQLFNFSTKNNYKYIINQIIEKNNMSIIIKAPIRIKTSYNRTQKGYIIQCLKCNYEFENTEANLDRGDMCPVCSNHRIIKGINDIWTTNPEIAKYLTNPDEGYIYSQFSNVKLDFTCPFCNNNIGIKLLSTVSNSGISCPSCGDNISYPNKFMFNLLTELGETFLTEQGYDWCIFPDFNEQNNFSHGRYDFLIENKKLIIEMDSSLGHGKQLYTNSNKSIEETIYRDKMKDLKAKELGYTVIRIDCSYYTISDRFNNCVNGVLNSILSEIYNLSNIDWNVINNKCMESFIIKSAELYNQGRSSGEIADLFNKDLSTIIDYLHQATKCGLCNFIPYKQCKKRGGKNA